LLTDLRQVEGLRKCRRWCGIGARREEEDHMVFSDHTSVLLNKRSGDFGCGYPPLLSSR
jgi:hypothetical protein